MMVAVDQISTQITKNLINLIEKKIEELFLNQIEANSNLKNEMNVLINFYENYEGFTASQNYKCFVSTNCYDELMRISSAILYNKKSDFSKYFEIIGDKLRQNFSTGKSTYKKVLKTCGEAARIITILKEMEEISEMITLFLSNIDNKIQQFNCIRNKVNLLDNASFTDDELSQLDSLFQLNKDKKDEFIAEICKTEFEKEIQEQIVKIYQSHLTAIDFSKEIIKKEEEIQIIYSNLLKNVSIEWAKQLSVQVTGFVQNRVMNPIVNSIVNKSSFTAFNGCKKLFKLKFKKKELTDSEAQMNKERKEILNGEKASMKVIELLSKKYKIMLVEFDPVSNKVLKVLREPEKKINDSKEIITLGYDGKSHIYPLTRNANSNKIIQAGKFDCAYSAFLYSKSRQKGKSDLDSLNYASKENKITNLRRKVADKLLKKWSQLENKNISSEKVFGNLGKKRSVAEGAKELNKRQRKEYYSKSFKDLKEYKFEHSLLRFRRMFVMTKTLAGLNAKVNKIDKSLFGLIKIEEGSQTQNDKGLGIKKQNKSYENKSDTVQNCNKLNQIVKINSLTHLNSCHTLGVHIDLTAFKEKIHSIKADPNLSNKQKNRIKHIEHMVGTIETDLGHTLLGQQGYNLGWERCFDVHQTQILKSIHSGLVQGSLNKKSMTELIYKSKYDLCKSLQYKADSDSLEVKSHLEKNIIWNEKLKIIEYKYE